VGRQTLAHALELARTADAVGFDFVTVSEHHATPMMCTPNASLMAAALTQVVKRAAIAWLGPIIPMTAQIEAFQKATGAGVLDLAFGAGGFGHEATLASVRRFGGQVLPRIRDL
jgi:hypothetical protein